jgi:aspartyl/asparaginyl-tRNA synthetase
MPVWRVENHATRRYLVAEYAEMARELTHASLHGR